MQTIGEFDWQNQLKEVAEIVADAIKGDPKANLAFAKKVMELPMLFKDAIYMSKLKKYVTEVNQENASLGDNVADLDAMFETPKKQRKYTMFLMNAIDKVETEDKISYIVNATRSFRLQLITQNDWLRIIKAITETLSDDLEYLEDLIEHPTAEKDYKGNIQILALARAGLMIQDGIDGNEGIESQHYSISKLGIMVYEYALALGRDGIDSNSTCKNESKKAVINLPPNATGVDVIEF